MKQYLLFFLLIPIFGFAQQQIGQTLSYITPTDITGRSLAISANGNIVAIGSPANDSNNFNDSGTVRVFRNQVGVWTQIGLNINGTTTNNFFGRTIALSADGNIVAIASND